MGTRELHSSNPAFRPQSWGAFLAGRGSREKGPRARGKKKNRVGALSLKSHFSSFLPLSLPRPSQRRRLVGYLALGRGQAKDENCFRGSDRKSADVVRKRMGIIDGPRRSEKCAGGESAGVKPWTIPRDPSPSPSSTLQLVKMSEREEGRARK